MEDFGKLSCLVSSIQNCVDTIELHVKSNDVRIPSFDHDSSILFELPPAAEAARQGALESMDQLRALLLGPVQYLMDMTSPKINISTSLHAIYRFKVAQHLAIDETVSYETLADRCELEVSDLKRFVRMATTYRVFSEPSKGFVAHNALSKLLACAPDFQDWLGVVCEEMMPAGANCVPAVSKWPGSKDIAHTGFVLANRTATPFFDVIETDPGRASRFANAMKVICTAPALDVSLFTNSLDWTGEDCPKRVVDIGGSTGALGRKLLDQFPGIAECIVEDLPGMLDGIDTVSELGGKLRFQRYSFLEKQPVANADCYILRWILHDWPDDYAVKILQNQIPALKPGATIIINEICLPDPGILLRHQEQFLRGFDLSMKLINNGKERDAEDWKVLVKKADGRLCIKRIVTPPGSLLSSIELTFEPTR